MRKYLVLMIVFLACTLLFQPNGWCPPPPPLPGLTGNGTESPSFKAVNVRGAALIGGGENITALANPTGTPSATPSASGGTMGASAYNYAQVVAYDVNFPTLNSVTLPGTISAAATTTGSTASINWSWPAVPGASGYLVFVCTGSACTPSNYFTSSTNSYTQTAPASSGTVGTLPTKNQSGSLQIAGLTAAGGNADTTGTLTGLIPIVTVNGSDVTLTAQQCRGGYVVVSSSNKVIIPSGLSAGANFQVRVNGAVTAKIVPPSGGYFNLNGVAQTANYILSSTGVTGDEVMIVYDGTSFEVDPSPTCTWTAGAT